MKKTVLIITLIITATISFAQEVSFSDVLTLPSTRSAATSASDGTNIYVANGFTDGSLYTSEVYKFDGGWSTLTNETISKCYASAAYANNKLYVFNGLTSGGYNNQMEVIDPDTGAITLSTVNPSPAKAGGVSVWNDEIYAFGGETSSGVFSDNVYKFNPTSETWAFVTTMPIAAETKGEIVNGKLYIFGGYGSGGSLNSIHVYDIAGDSWNTAPNMPNTLSATTTAVFNDVIWLVGDYANQTFVASFDTNTNTLSQRNSNLNNRRHATAEVIDGTLYAIGGSTTSALSSAINSVQRASVEEFFIPTAERDVLMAIYNATNGANWTNNSNWNTAYAESTWSGVTVEEVLGEYHVTGLLLSSNNLSGLLSPEIGNLSKLEVLDLWENNLTGTIPSEIGNCTNLKTVTIEDNQLTGNIPASFSALTAIQSFWVNGNQLSGDIPDIFSGWTNLIWISLGSEYSSTHNTFSGVVDLSNNNALKYCWVDNTNITTLNVKNTNNSNMSDTYFHAKNTPNLSCIIVDDVTYSTNTWTNINSTSIFAESEADCTQRYVLMDLFNATNGVNWTENTNWNTSNSIDTWFGITVVDGFVTKINLPYNNLVGTIPASITDLTHLQELKLGSNYLNGTVPDLGLVDTIEIVDIVWNEFSFEDIETNYTSNNAITSFKYQDQRYRDTEDIIDAVLGNNYSLAMTPINGTNVQYQWYRARYNYFDESDEIMVGVTGNTYDITNLQDADFDAYTCKATSTIIPDLTIRRNIINIRGTVSQDQKDALIAFYNTTNGDNWNDNTNWLSAEPVSEWFGVTVEGNDVTQLGFFNNNITGSVPAEIGDLTKLQYLAIASDYDNDEANNTLEGNLPSEIGNLIELRVLAFENTNVTGEIPVSYNNLTKLRGFWLWGDKLSGNVPEFINTFSNLVFIGIDHNDFEGTLPDFSGLSKLRYLKIDNNHFYPEDFSDQFNDYVNLYYSWDDSSYYSPQYTVDPEEETLVPEVGESITLTVTDESSSSKSTYNILAPNEYQWFKDDVAISGANADTYTITNAQTSDSGVYHAEITNPDIPDYVIIRPGITVDVGGTLGFNEEQINHFIIYPNPANDEIHILQKDDIAINKINIYDSRGRLILGTTSKLIDVHNLEAGIYMVKVMDTKGKSTSKKLIIK